MAGNDGLPFIQLFLRQTQAFLMRTAGKTRDFAASKCVESPSLGAFRHQGVHLNSLIGVFQTNLNGLGALG